MVSRRELINQKVGLMKLCLRCEKIQTLKQYLKQIFLLISLNQMFPGCLITSYHPSSSPELVVALQGIAFFGMVIYVYTSRTGETKAGRIFFSNFEEQPKTLNMLSLPSLSSLAMPLNYPQLDLSLFQIMKKKTGFFSLSLQRNFC